MFKFGTREEWLLKAYQLLSPRFDQFSQKLPAKINIIPSWSYRSPRKYIGMQFPSAWTENKSIYITISPLLSENNPGEILATLLHEMIHALGISKHGKDFKKIAHKLMLTGPMKATESTPELRDSFLPLVKELGSYPHTAMMPPATVKKEGSKKKQLLKFISADPDLDGYSVWVTPAQFELHGAPFDPSKKEMVVG